MNTLIYSEPKNKLEILKFQIKSDEKITISFESHLTTVANNITYSDYIKPEKLRSEFESTSLQLVSHSFKFAMIIIKKKI